MADMRCYQLYLAPRSGRSGGDPEGPCRLDALNATLGAARYREDDPATVKDAAYASARAVLESLAPAEQRELVIRARVYYTSAACVEPGDTVVLSHLDGTGSLG